MKNTASGEKSQSPPRVVSDAIARLTRDAEEVIRAETAEATKRAEAKKVQSQSRTVVAALRAYSDSPVPRLLLATLSPRLAVAIRVFIAEKLNRWVVLASLLHKPELVGIRPYVMLSIESAQKAIPDVWCGFPTISTSSSVCIEFVREVAVRAINNILEEFPRPAASTAVVGGETVLIAAALRATPDVAFMDFSPRPRVRTCRRLHPP